MTYDNIIELVRTRGRAILKGESWEKGVIYDAVNSACIEYAKSAKTIETSASLSLVAGTRDYTISSAIGSDVGEITLVVIDSGTIEGIELRRFQDEIHADVDDEDDIANGTPEYFRTWNGVLRVYPTPDQAKTATVYYTKKVAQGFYSTATGASTFPFADEYATPIAYEALAILAEGLPDMKTAEYYRVTAKTKLDEVLASKEDYSYDSQIKYQDPIGN